MVWIIKLCGMVLLLTASTAIGYLRAFLLERRARKLQEFEKCITELKERIYFDGGEISRLLKSTFGGKDLIEVHNDRVKLCNCGITVEDAAVLEEYFAKLGAGEGENECARAKLYLTLLEKQRKEAEQKVAELSRLYRILGFSAGIFGLIFFL